MAKTHGDAEGGHDVVAKFMEFQRTGAGFDAVWTDIHPTVADFARRNLRKLGVRARAGDAAEGDVVSATVIRLMGLSAPGAGGRFDPARAAGPGFSGLRGWLWKVVASQAAAWVRDERGGRTVKIVPETALEWNDVSGGDDGLSVVQRQVAKVDRAELLPILEQCINELADPELRQVVRMQLDKGLSQRAMADRLRVSATTIHRQLQSAYALLRPRLEQRGLDDAWLAA